MRIIEAMLRAKTSLRSSQTAEKQKNDQNDYDQAQSTAGVVAPASAMRPSGQTAKRKQDENDQQN
jgi:hypothetical protein